MPIWRSLPKRLCRTGVVHTRQLQAMLAGPGPPILIDVLTEEEHVTLGGAVSTGRYFFGAALPPFMRV